MTRRAAVLIIGNEILSGKIADENINYIAKELFAIGVKLQRIVVCPDELDVIASDVRTLSDTHDFVFTTGGVGPTHDDMTIDGVALGFGVPVVRSAEMEKLLRTHYRDRITEGHLRMADMPEGAELVRSAEMPWPTVKMKNVVIFPGVPDLLKMKFPLIRDRFLRDGDGFFSRAVYTFCDEGEIAALLHTLVAQFPSVSIGSYIKWRSAEYTTKLTFDGPDLQAVEAAAQALRDAIGADKLANRQEG